MVVAIVVVAMLATAFLSAFSVVLRNSASPLQTGIMEEIAATRLDMVMALPIQSAIKTAPVSTDTVGGTGYTVTFTSTILPNSIAPVTANFFVTVSCIGCANGTSLAGDVYGIW